MGGNFKFQAQDSFLEYFFWEIGRFEKRTHFLKKGTFKLIVGKAEINQTGNR